MLQRLQKPYSLPLRNSETKQEIKIKLKDIYLKIFHFKPSLQFMEVEDMTLRGGQKDWQ